MKTMRAIVFFILGAVFAVSLTAKDPPEEFKKKLFDKYDQKLLICLPKGIVVGLPPKDYVGFGKRNFGVGYNHFHEAVALPKRAKDLESIDDRTFVVVAADADSIRRIAADEKMKVTKLYLHDDSIEMELRPISATSLGRSERTGGTTRPYGVEFYFMFPKTVIESGDYDTVVREVNKYLLPVDEYKDVAEAAKKIEIQPGMSKDEVIKSMGEPAKTLVFGKKTILKYTDVTIELEDDKVTELKAN